MRFCITSSDALVDWRDFVGVRAVNRETVFKMLVFLGGG